MIAVTSITKAAQGWAAGLRRVFSVIPRPLAALLTVVLIIGLVWALIVPPWQAPDATTHFAYAQSLAERFALPGDKRRATDSTDQLLADAASEASLEAFNPKTVKPGGWSSQRYAGYLAAVRSHPSRSNGGGPNSASSNPPLYYLYADLAYWAMYGGDVFDRLYAIQIWGVALLMLTVTGAWMLAGEVLGCCRLPQLACAATAGFVPLETFITTSVNPDALMVTLWTFALWLGARVIVRGARQRDAVVLCAVTAGAILTKATSYALVPAVLLALGLGWLRRPPEERSAARRQLATALVALVLPVLGWLGLAHLLGRAAVNAVPSSGHPFNVRQFLSYVWQFYLPRLPWQTPFRAVNTYPAWYIWLKQGWGIFGWLDVPMADWVYRVLGVITAVILIPATALVARFRDRLRLSLTAFFAVALVALLGLLHITDYAQIIKSGGTLLQGRYLLPVVGLFGLSVGFVISHLPGRWRGPACGTTVAGLLLLQVLALGTVARMYYT